VILTNEASAEAAADRIFYDGTCGLCHLAVLFVLRYERRGEESFRFAPRSLRDRTYDLVARLRGRFFGRPEAVCPTVDRELRKRFDP
jgi:predicted DCC family thiol-disulfide oxidoreductase YuxK